jgi:hypothetical protein
MATCTEVAGLQNTTPHKGNSAWNLLTAVLAIFLFGSGWEEF